MDGSEAFDSVRDVTDIVTGASFTNINEEKKNSEK